MISDVEALRKALLTKVPVAAAVPLDELRAELLKDFSSATVEIGMGKLVMQRVVAVQAGAVSLPPCNLGAHNCCKDAWYISFIVFRSLRVPVLSD